MDDCAESCETAADESWHVFRLTVGEVADHHGQKEVCLDVQTKQLSDLVSPLSDFRLIIQNQLVDNVLQDVLAMRLDSVFCADNQIIQLAQALLLQIDLQREVLNVLQNASHQLVQIPPDDVPGALSRHLTFLKEVKGQNHIQILNLSIFEPKPAIY